MQSIVSPKPIHGSLSLRSHSPFHPYRPPTPTARALAADTDRFSSSLRGRTHPGRFIHARSTMQKTLGQLLAREWMIEEAEEYSQQNPQQDSDRAELEKTRAATQRSIPTTHCKPLWPTTCDNALPDMSPMHYMPSPDLGIGGCRSWNGRRKSTMNDISTVFLGVSDLRESM
ncbi:hypothetical protein BDF22DRAFT_689863, partial [Syncephalis plumigaleata]